MQNRPQRVKYVHCMLLHVRKEIEDNKCRLVSINFNLKISNHTNSRLYDGDSKTHKIALIWKDFYLKLSNHSTLARKMSDRSTNCT